MITSIFVFVVMSVIYVACAVYVYTQSRRVLSRSGWDGWFYTVFWTITSLAYPVTYFFAKRLPDPLFEWLSWWGGIGLGFGLYNLIVLLIFHFARLVMQLLGLRLLMFTDKDRPLKKVAPWVAWSIALILTYNGVWNVKHPEIRPIRIQLFKPMAKRTELRIVLVSDLNLGPTFKNKRVGDMVDQIDRLSPDAIVILGNIVTHPLSYSIRHHLGEELRQLKAPMGVYAVVGDGEYAAHVDNAIAYIEQNGVNILRDEQVLLDQSVYLVGRDDVSRTNYVDSHRAELKTLLSEVDRTKPIVVLDHQPSAWHEGLENKVDVYLGGHLPAGQLWPLDYLVESLYGVKIGYQSFNPMQLYISSGYGTPLIPLRIGHRPEIVLLTLVSG